ncbi:MAG: SDR family NAD(P)-dependent oxidoreductase [Chlorobi bacterium]|nr:SDR family NAD(P)-dependent oxidoreductase [Chlorobiota bacterium]
MPSFKEKYGPWAVIAGAAEGLGKAYSVSLAGKGLNLLMIDNQKKILQTLATELEKKYVIQTMTLHLDLGENEAVKKIMAAVGEKNAGLLVYNAAVSRISRFTELPPEVIDTFVEVNVKTQIRLVHAFSKNLIAKNRPGGILLMSSLAGLIGMQLVAPYAASKAFAGIWPRRCIMN